VHSRLEAVALARQLGTAPAALAAPVSQ
jgi:hypothetical protein